MVLPALTATQVDAQLGAGGALAGFQHQMAAVDGRGRATGALGAADAQGHALAGQRTPLRLPLSGLVVAADHRDAGGADVPDG